MKSRIYSGLSCILSEEFSVAFRHMLLQNAQRQLFWFVLTGGPTHSLIELYVH